MITYSISKNLKSIWRSNPISGHTWPEYIPGRRYRVTGGFLIDRDFSSIERAVEAVKFDIKFNLPHYRPNEAYEIQIYEAQLQGQDLERRCLISSQNTSQTNIFQ